MKVSWSHCVLRVHDLDAMVDFYCEALGFRLTDRGPLGDDGEIAFLSGSSSDHHQLGLTNSREPNKGGSLDHNAFRVESVDDVKQIIDWVESDARIGSGFPISHGNAVSVYFADPEGNGIEVFADTPWHVPQPQVGGWDPKQSADEVLETVKARYENEAGFMPMDEYRSAQAGAFGED